MPPYCNTFVAHRMSLSQRGPKPITRETGLKPVLREIQNVPVSHILLKDVYTSYRKSSLQLSVSLSDSIYIRTKDIGTNAMPGSLVDLPPEILELVAWHMDGSDLLRLRLVNKYIAASTERPMLEKNFSELHMMLSVPRSLNKGLKVMRSEHLRRFVAYVYIYIPQFCSLSRCDLSERRLREGTATPPRACPERHKHARLYRKSIQGQQLLSSTNSDEAKLCEIFRLINPKLGLDLKVVDFLEDGFQPRDLKKLNAKYGGEPCMFVPYDDHRPLQVVMNAIQTSGVPLNGFVVDAAGYGVPIAMFGLDGCFQQLRKPFHHLTNVGFDLQQFSGMQEQLSCRDCVQHVVDFLQGISQNLIYLHLGVESPTRTIFDESDLDAIMELMMHDVHFPAIQGFSFKTILVDYHKFFAWLAHHCKTLEILNFDNVIASNTGCDLAEEDFQNKALKDLLEAGLPAPVGDDWSIFNHDVEY